MQKYLYEIRNKVKDNVMQKISVTIITFNEEKKIRQCINSVKTFADEIIVVDSNSTDSTESICKELGVNFIKQNWLGYSEQKTLPTNWQTMTGFFH